MRIKKYIILLILTVAVYSCSDTKKSADDDPIDFLGTWSAEWATDPALYPDDLNFSSFTMNGKLIFYPDSVEINVYGFEGCIFTNDTMRHAMMWKVSSDTALHFQNADDSYPSISYTIEEINENVIKLQFLGDISLTLKK